ncbi:MAG: tRNA (adenosine(37)-N6)-threonylcarbamoyltransferase complex dimerization subunit type 1 TsaB [Acidobacteria bacterium]|nr:tRNA (adenosine(37)-N6)-threonylcarbamoyltransferase complex dimerization subunit type 1 TsaB [Acidobacteriota bacterium]
MPRRFLAIDTASPAPSLAFGEKLVKLSGAATEELPARVSELLELAGATLADVEGVAVLSGPGSFTGIRAGIAFGRGLARGRGVPFVLLGTFDVAARALGDLGLGDAALHLSALRGQVHVAIRRGPTLRIDGAPRSAAEASAEALELGLEVVDLGSRKLPLAGALAHLAGSGFEGGAGPAYGRPSAAEEKLGAA